MISVLIIRACLRVALVAALLLLDELEGIWLDVKDDVRFWLQRRRASFSSLLRSALRLPASR